MGVNFSAWQKTEQKYGISSRANPSLRPALDAVQKMPSWEMTLMVIYDLKCIASQPPAPVKFLLNRLTASKLITDYPQFECTL
jgi:hypothetical protein